MDIPVKVKKFKRTLGDIKKSPVFNKKSFIPSNKVKFAYFLAGGVLGAMVVLGVIVTMNKEYEIPNFIKNDFAEIYALDTEKLFGDQLNFISVKNIQNSVKSAQNIFRASNINDAPLYEVAGNKIWWLFRGNEVLVLVAKEEKSDKLIKSLITGIEPELKKDFNIASSIYRNTVIGALTPSKNSRFAKPVYYALDFKNYILVSDNAAFIKKTIDDILDGR